jgi:hypothetical protein
MLENGGLRRVPVNGGLPRGFELPHRVVIELDQVLQVKVKSHAEHEQHHAELRGLLREVPVGDEARREGADDDAREQVPDRPSAGNRPSDGADLPGSPIRGNLEPVPGATLDS